MVAVALLSVASPDVDAQEPRPGQLVFYGGNEVGEVWAHVGLTARRLDEDYLPMVVAVVNRRSTSVSLDRDAIRVIGPRGVRYPMPTLRELRKRYNRQRLDQRAVSAAGIPWEVWRRDRRLVEANFFPELTSGRRAIVIDELSLPPGGAMIDLLYFAKPPGLAVGDPFIVEVQAVGWPAPLRLAIVLR
jgi:hypothetical protein